MSPFDLSSYEPVEDRLREFWKDHPAGRIATELVHVGEDGYIVKASIWREFDLSDPANREHQAGSTGYAQEAVTQRGVNATSALENCETSAIGRALANLGYAPKGKRPSREEMVSASSSPARSQEPVSTSGRDGEERGEGAEGTGEGPEASSPPHRPEPAVPGERAAGSGALAGPYDPHPNKPHILKDSKTLEGARYCIVKGCDFVIAPEDAKPVRA